MTRFRLPARLYQKWNDPNPRRTASACACSVDLATPCLSSTCSIPSIMSSISRARDRRCGWGVQDRYFGLERWRSVVTGTYTDEREVERCYDDEGSSVGFLDTVYSLLQLGGLSSRCRLLADAICSPTVTSTILYSLWSREFCLYLYLSYPVHAAIVLS